MKNKSEGTLQGISISHWQRYVNFAQIKKRGIKVVYIKATEGTFYIDPTLTRNYTDARAEGLLVGFYHCLRPIDEADAVDQAKHFISTISDINYDCKLALNLEFEDTVEKYLLNKISEIFLKEIKKLTGEDAIICTTTNFAKKNLNTSLSKYPLWIVDFQKEVPDENFIWDDWVGFQYSNSEMIDGVSGNGEMSFF
ncbi:GH25 family lysozyme, partial [Clostridium tarantellae]